MMHTSSNKRPVLDLRRTTGDTILEIIGIGALLFVWVVLAKYWPQLPQTIATHFDLSGQPDGWGDKNSLFILPVLGTVMYSMLGLLSRYPHTFNYVYEITLDNAAIQYILARTLVNWLRTFVVLLFAYIEASMILSARDNISGLGPWFLAVTLTGAFAPVAIYMVQASRHR